MKKNILSRIIPVSFVMAGLTVALVASAQTSTDYSTTGTTDTTTGSTLNTTTNATGTTGTGTTTTTPGLPETGLGGMAALLSTLLVSSGALVGGAGSLLSRSKE